MRENARVGAKTLLSKKGAALFDKLKNRSASADLFFLRKTGPLPSENEGRGRYIHANVSSVRTQSSRILACSRFRSSKVSGFFPGSRSRAAG